MSHAWCLQHTNSHIRTTLSEKTYMPIYPLILCKNLYVPIYHIGQVPCVPMGTWFLCRIPRCSYIGHAPYENIRAFVESPFVHVVLLDIGAYNVAFLSIGEQLGESCETRSTHKRICKYKSHSKKGGKMRIVTKEVGSNMGCRKGAPIMAPSQGIVREPMLQGR